MRKGVLMLAASLALVAVFAVPASSRSLMGTVLRFDNNSCLALTSRKDQGWLIRDIPGVGEKHYRLVHGEPNKITLSGAGYATVDLRPDRTFTWSDPTGSSTGHWSPGESCQ
jgi:hypothetical protein